MNPQSAHALHTLAGTVFIIWCMGFALFVTWIVSLIDVIKSDYVNPSNKTIWLLLLIFLAPLGTILYTLIGRSQKVCLNNIVIDKQIKYTVKSMDNKNKPNDNGKWF